jgi:hypothetical protein
MEAGDEFGRVGWTKSTIFGGRVGARPVNVRRGPMVDFVRPTAL